MELIIEQYSRSHKLLNRQKLDKPSISVGRAFDNDIIVSDPYVCPYHLQLTQQDGSWQVEDLDSVNGIQDARHKPVEAHSELPSGAEIFIGKTSLRLLRPDHPVAPSIRFSPMEALLGLMKQPWLIALVLLSFVALNSVENWLNAEQSQPWIQLVVPALAITLVSALWPLMVSLIARFTKNDARVGIQLSVNFLFFIAILLASGLVNLVEFNLGSHWLNTIFSNGLMFSLIFSLLWLNLYISFHHTSTKRVIISLGLLALLFGSAELIQRVSEPKFDPRPNYDATLMPPWLQISSGQEVTDFIEDTNNIFEKLDKQVAKDENKKG